jgi:hypothetical protein
MTEPATKPTPPQPDPTGEPARDPNAEASTEAASAESSSEDAAEVAATPEGRAAAEVAATAATGTTADAIAAADAAGDEGATAETAAAIAAAAATATAVAETRAAEAAAGMVVAETPAKEEAGPSRRTAAGRVLRQLGVVALSVGLFVGGIALGSYLFQTTRPAPAGGGGTGVVVNSEGPPPVAQEFISALSRNDADALRSSLDQEPHLDLTREMTKFGIQRVDNVEVLGTHVDGGRSATEILMQYESTDGTPFAINLVILVDGGKIEGFR